VAYSSAFGLSNRKKIWEGLRGRNGLQENGPGGGPGWLQVGEKGGQSASEAVKVSTSEEGSQDGGILHRDTW